MPYEVQTPVFEGPFDLLLHLILRSQLDVYEISLSAIIDAYVAEMERMGGLDLDVATEFVLIAATLIELKTKGLLPGHEDVELDEELALWEERDLLLSRLLECKTFKDASAELSRLASLAERSYPRRGRPGGKVPRRGPGPPRRGHPGGPSGSDAPRPCPQARGPGRHGSRRPGEAERR